MLEETKFKESLNYYDDTTHLSYKEYSHAMIFPNGGNWIMRCLSPNAAIRQKVNNRITVYITILRQSKT